MQSSGKVLVAGIFIGLLMFKPTFGVALAHSVGSLMTVAFEPSAPRPTEQPPLANVPDPSEERAAIFAIIERIINRLDKLELMGQSNEPDIVVNEELLAPSVNKTDKVEQEPPTLVRGVIIKETYSDSMNTKQFDSEFNKKFGIISKAE